MNEKIRIFKLSKELGIDSKELIQHCNDAGLDVKSSSLASITPDERDVLMAHLAKVRAPAATAKGEDASTPTREAAVDRSAKVRQIRTLGPLGGTMRRRTRGDEEETPSGDTATAVISPAEPVDGTEPAPAVEPEVDAIDEDEVERAPAPVADAEAPPAEKKGGSTISRADYVAPTGGSGLAGIREMKPRGSIRELESKTRRERPKKAPALPSVATPTFKAPTAPVKTEGPAQKPEVRLTADLLKKSSPLASILKKHKDEGKKPKPLVEEEEAGEAKGKTRALGLAEGRDIRRKKRQRTRDSEDDSETSGPTKLPKRHRRSGPVALKTAAVVSMPMTVREFSEELGRPARDIIGILFRTGRVVTMNDALEEETALEVALELGIDLTIEKPATPEDSLMQRLELSDEELGVPLVTRPPIITILGHVDHGKTTLVDRIRSSNVVAGEAGGITQHIAAYQVEHNGHKLTFVDTPGHAAFGEMRARGANVTDIIVLVVAADDGVMPQTVECISHAKAAGVPIVVAMNKTDLPGVDQQRVLTGLSQHEILPVEWGGDTEVVRISALKGTGVDNLLETLLLTAELNELTAPADVPAEGVCLEAFRDEGLGPLAWLIVRRGTLRVGDVVVCGGSFGRVRAMYNDRGGEVTEAGPSTPVKVAGLNQVPQAGDHFFGMPTLEAAREAAESRLTRGRTELLTGRGGPRSLEEFFADRDGSVRTLPLILKADTPGSIEALRGELEKFEHPEVKVKILHYGVGGVNESDVTLAASAGAIVIAFHVVAEDRAQSLADREGVQIRRYDIIYNLTDDIKKSLEGLLRPERVEVATGRAFVLRTFPISRIGTIAGCRVMSGTIERTNRVHVIRDQTVLNDYAIASLKREKDDAREVREGMECGIRLDGFNDVKEGDLLEAYRIEERKRTLDE
ncbi:MAG: translation initiation factor IF-2 [Planctomycetaceae bacterium]